MTQPPYGQPPQYGYAPPPPGVAPPPPAAPAPAANIALGVVVTVWAGLGLFLHAGATLYLTLGWAMVQTPDGVFGDDANGAFNWAVLLIALIGQLLGLAASVLAILLGIRARGRRLRRATTAMVLGIIAASVFLLIGLIQLPLVALLVEMITNGTSSAFTG